MKRLPFFLLFFITACGLQAQVISEGLVYGKKDWQYAFQSYTDHSGNRYTTVSFGGDPWVDPENLKLFMDSAGIPISIAGSTEDIGRSVILKYDSNGFYQYHIGFNRSLNFAYGQAFSLSFDQQDNVYLGFSISNGDSLKLFHSNGLLFKHIKSHTPDSFPRPSGLVPQFCLVLAKLNARGEYQWATTVENKTPDQYTLGSVGLNQRSWSQRIFTNNANELSAHYDNFWHGHTHDTDTLRLTDPQGQQSSLPVSSRDVVLRFSSNGNLVNYYEPFKNRLSHLLPDTAPQGFYRSVTDGINSYSVYRFHATGPDTFRCHTPVPLLPGLNYILFKTDAQDEIIWAKHIGLDQYTYPHHYFHLDYSAHRKQLVLGFAYTPAVFSFTHNPVLNGSSFYTDLYVSTYDTSGAVLWEKTYGGTAHETMQSLTYNHKTNQLTLIGTTQSDDLILGKYLLQANNGTQGKVYVAVIDSTNEVCSAQLIHSLSANIAYTDIGYPVTDHKGRTFISGWFFDSIQLACNKAIYATRWISQFNTERPDGFVLVMEPHTVVDTGVCYLMRSPSSRYIWDSSAVYFDTIPDVSGCDSVLVFRLKVLNTTSTLDTAVCRQLQSMSGKYLWDSAGIYMDTLVNVHGCDSIMTVRLSLLNSMSAFDSVVKVYMRSPSGKFIWDSSATYHDTVPSARGCDSIMTVNVKVLQTKSEIDTAVCGTMRSPSGRYIYSQPGIYTDTISNAAGGDSIITIKVLMLHTESSLDTATCKPLTSPSGRYLWDITGMYDDTLINHEGCDSIMHIRLLVIPLLVSVSKSNDIQCGITHARLYVTGGSRYTWSPATGLSDVTAADPYASPDTTTLYRVLVNDTLGCSAYDSLELIVLKQPDVHELPNVFTPNYDGINDCLPLKAVAELRQADLLIFNRWGTKVFHTQQPDACWNGKDEDGDELNAGVYFYLLKGTGPCDEKIEQHGTITLIR